MTRIVRAPEELGEFVDMLRRNRISCGFVPTMGALHAGHASLIRRSVRENDRTVVSVYVNPLQFGDGADLDAYPRTLDDDVTVCERERADIVFAPSVKDMQPPGCATVVSVRGISDDFEGVGAHIESCCTAVERADTNCYATKENQDAARELANDPEVARSTANEILAIAEGRGFHSAESLALIIRGWARASLGEPDEGVRDVERGLALAETSGSDVVTPRFYVASAHVHRMAKNRRRAEELLDQAKALDERDGTTPHSVDVMFADALIHLEFGDGLPEVENLLLQAVGHADTFGTHWTGLRISTQLARIAPQTGKIREAHDRLAVYYEKLTEGFDRAPAREAQAMLEELAGVLASDPSAS